MYRIRIKRAPYMERGGDVDGASARTVLPGVHPMEANIEAEKGETIVGDFDGDALAEHYKIQGKKHSMGGTPLLVPQGSFVFSDAKKLKIGGPVVEEFGKNPNSKRKYTFAELAKQYNVNKYKALLGGQMSDKYTKDTAQVMLDNYERKLAKLALLQEGMKGFPQGIPAMALPLAEEMGIQLGGQVGGGPMPGMQQGMPMPPQGGGRGPMPPMPPGAGMMGMPPEGEMGPMGPMGPMPPGMEGMPPEMMMGPEAGMMPPGGPMGPEEMVDDAGGLSAEQEYDQDVLGSPMERYGGTPLLRYGGWPRMGYGGLPRAAYGGWLPRNEYGLPKAAYGFIMPGAMQVLAAQQAAAQQAAQAASTPPAKGKGKPKVNIYAGDQTDPTREYQVSKKLTKDFNKFSADWLKDYGYDNTGEGMAQALIDAGYTGDLEDTKGIQDFLIDKNLEKGNYKLFNDLMVDWGVTTQGAGQGVDDKARFTSSKDPEEEKKTRERLGQVFADNKLGVRTGELLKGIVKKKEVPKVAKKEVAKVVPKTPVAGPKTGDFTPTAGRPDIGMPLWQQDRNNSMASFLQKMNLQTMGPTYFGRDVYLPQPTFYDTTRQLAANQEAANAQGMLSAMYAGPQRLRAVGSSIQGQGAGNAANILGQVQNQNVSEDDRFKLAATELLNSQAAAAQQSGKLYADEWTTARQQRINAEALANMNMLNNLNQGITNAQETYWLNRMNKQFQIDPSSGRLFFTRGNDLVPGRGGGSGEGSGSDYFTAYQYYLQNADPTDIQGAREYAQYKSGMKGGKSSKDDDDAAAALLQQYRRGRTA